MKYRSRSEIVRSILEAANVSGGTSRTRLMYKSYLAFNQLKEYLTLLVENALIEYEEGMRTYRTTEKGIRLLKIQSEMVPIKYIKEK